MSVTILDHALIQHKLTIMRDKNTSTYIFKQNLDEIAKLMACLLYTSDAADE